MNTGTEGTRVSTKEKGHTDAARKLFLIFLLFIKFIEIGVLGIMLMFPAFFTAILSADGIDALRPIGIVMILTTFISWAGYSIITMILLIRSPSVSSVFFLVGKIWFYLLYFVNFILPSADTFQNPALLPFLLLLLPLALSTGFEFFSSRLSTRIHEFYSSRRFESR